MEIRLHVDPDSDNPIIVRAKEILAEDKEAERPSYNKVEGLTFHQGEFGLYTSVFEPVLPQLVQELPIVLVTLQDEVDTELTLGCHIRGETEGWVTNTTRQQYGHPSPERQFHFRNIRVYGPDLESVLSLYRQILGRAQPTSVPEASTEEDSAEH